MFVPLQLPVSVPARTHDTTTAESPPARPAAAPRLLGLALVFNCTRPEAGGGLLPLQRETRVVLGRGPRRVLEPTGVAARWTFDDPKLSAEHALLRVHGRTVMLEDRGSKTGTFVGGERIDHVVLQAGQVFRAGDGFFALIEDVEPRRAGRRLGIETFHGEFARELDRLEKLAVSPLPLLLMGETGTGKEVLAQALHVRSGRPGPLIPVNCGALPAGLVEAQLFGHQRGAFSGAIRDEPGFVRRAAGGTLFLDEIGDLPLEAQASLLRVLQGGEVTPVGASRPERVDVRVLAATHRDLPRLVQEGRFREDLYARLAGFVARVPPLRERRGDLGLLISSWIAAGRLPPLRFEPEAAQRLLEYEWPWNVRELLQTLQAAAALAEREAVRLEHLPHALRAPPPALRDTGLSEEDAALRDELIRRLRERRGNITHVARDMGKARQQVQRWMRRFGLKR